MSWVTFRTAAYLCFWLEKRGARTNLFSSYALGSFICILWVLSVSVSIATLAWNAELLYQKWKVCLFQGFFTQGCWIFCHLWLQNSMSSIRILLPGIVLRGYTLQRCHSWVNVKLEWEWALYFIYVCSLLHGGSWSFIDACKLLPQ